MSESTTPDEYTRVFEAIERAGAPPGTSLLQKVAVTCALKKMWQKSIDMLEKVVR